MKLKTLLQAALGRRIFSVAWVILLVCATPNTQAQDKQEASSGATGLDAEQALVERWLKIYDSINSSLVVATDSDDQLQVVDQQKTLLTFLNPEFSGRHGRFYLWTRHGRPVMTSSFLSQIERTEQPYRTLIYEFHSLVQGNIRVEREGKMIWQCSQPGLDWMDGPKEMAPAASATKRLSQMRAIAQRYEAESKSNKFRLLSQPIYRYPANTPGVTDGAIFSYGLTTDPCVLLVIEARSEAWKIAFVRSNVNFMRVSEGSQEIWSRETVRDMGTNPEQPFFLFWGAEHRQIDDPNQVISTPWRGRAEIKSE